MEAYVVISEQVSYIYNEVFLTSLKKVEPEININEVKINFDGTGGIFTKGWYDAGWEKIKTIERVTRSLDNKIVAFFDADIIFLKPFSAKVYELMKNKDLLMQQDYEFEKKANIGVMFFRCNKKINDYINFLLKKRTEPNSWEEQIIRETINESGLSFDLLPRTFSNGTNKGLNKESYLYHANGIGNNFFGTSVERKYKKLIKMYKKYYLKRSIFGFNK